MSFAGIGGYPTVYYEDVYISESGKSKKDYLVGNIDHWIGNLVQRKDHIKTYRNYYNGLRDNKEYEYLTDNYGIGAPASLNFTNLIKARVDSLVEQVESDTLSYLVTCTDDKTIDLIQEKKKKTKLQNIFKAMDSFVSTMKAATKEQTHYQRDEKILPGHTLLRILFDTHAALQSESS